MTDDEFRAIAMSFPGAVDGFNMGSAYIKVNGKDLVRLLRPGIGMLTGISSDETDLLLEAEPDVFETDAHFRGGGCIRVHLAATTGDHMRGFLERRFREIAKKAIVKAWDAEQAP